MEGAKSSAQALHDADGSRQSDPEKDHDGGRARTLGFIWAIGIKAEAIASKQQMAA